MPTFAHLTRNIIKLKEVTKAERKQRTAFSYPFYMLSIGSLHQTAATRIR